jgi:hypothetical protein
LQGEISHRVEYCGAQCPAIFVSAGFTVERIRIDLDAAEYRALAQLAQRELRAVPDQVRHLLRQALKERGLLGEDRPPRTAVGDFE